MNNFNIHSAILIAHTKPSSNQNHIESVKGLMNHSMFNNNLSVNNLKNLIDNYGLKLRSTHMNALNNLYQNLMKAK